MSGPRTIVVGCGVVGAACAHWLSDAGCDVTMIDEGAFGGGCSAGNCGLICPSHVLPLALPGALGTALRMSLRRNAPLRVGLRFDPRLWRWLLRFAGCCRWERAWRGADALHPLLQESRRQYEALARELDFEFEPRGCLFVHSHREGFEDFRQVSDALRERFGLVSTALDGQELVAREPSLVEGLAGAWFFEDDAHMRPDRLMTAWRTRLASMGVEILERTEALAIEHGTGRARGVRSSAGAHPAEAIVFATGAWTPRLHRLLGVSLPIVPGKGYSLTSQSPAGAPRIPIIFEEERVAVTPMRSGFRLGSTMEFTGFDESMPEPRLELLRAAARKHLRITHSPLREERWFGWRPMTPDGLPFIDRLPHWSNVYVAAGHNMIGMASGPATGRLVADLVCARAPWTDPAPYRLAGRC